MSINNVKLVQAKEWIQEQMQPSFRTPINPNNFHIPYPIWDITDHQFKPSYVSISDVKQATTSQDIGEDIMFTFTESHLKAFANIAL